MSVSLLGRRLQVGADFHGQPQLRLKSGGDLAVDAPRDRARALLEKFDEHFRANLGRQFRVRTV